MKICQVGTGFVPVLPGVTGGAEKYVHHLSVALQGRGHEVTLIDMPSYRSSKVSYKWLEAPVTFRYDFNAVAHALRGLLFGRAAARRLEQLIVANAVELVNFHSQFTAVTGIPVARRLGIPTVFTMHNPLWSDAAACRSPWQRVKFWLEPRAERQADAVIGLSHSVMENRIRHFALSPAKVDVIPVGLDDFWFEPKSITPEVRDRYAANGEPVVLCVGRIAPYKNQLLLAQALPHLLAGAHSARLVFVGPSDSESYLRQVRAAVREASAQEHVIFAGAVPLEELAQLYALAQVVALPSLRENCPQALLEAMAQGKAIVAADIAPLREMLPEGTAVLVPPTEPGALAAALLRLLIDDRAREQLGARARRRASGVYHWEYIADRVGQVYGRIAAAGRTTVRAQRSLVRS